MKKVISLFFAMFFSFQICFAFPNSNRMNSKAGSVSQTMSASVKKDPKKYLSSLVHFLTSSSGGTETKVRIIHDWICNNIAYDTEMYFSGRTSKQDYVSVLKKGKGVCSGYSSIFMEMCSLAGIEAMRITGYSKGFGFHGELDESCAHEWNAVKIGNSWKLVDCCWDAGSVVWDTFVKNYSTEWYFLAPEAFIYSHLPNDEANQFLPQEKVRSKEQFLKEPFVRGRFFNYGFNFTDHSPDYNNLIDEETSYTLTLSKSTVSTTAELRDKNGKNIKNFSWVERKGNNYTYYFDVPDSKEYRASIFAKNQSDANYIDRFSVSEFEQKILPQAQNLISAKPISGKTISQEAFDSFSAAFIKIPEVDSYYYYENQFDRTQINAITSIFKILDVKKGMLESVLEFNIKASDSYTNFSSEPKYPLTFANYNSASNTSLISPRQNSLEKGKSYHFEIVSTNFSKFAFIHNGQWTFFVKNSSTGNFELDFEIPNDIETIELFASSNGKNYSGLVRWSVK